MAVQSELFQREQRSVNVPIWRELYMGLDWLALRWSPVYYGVGVPRGDGSAVIVVPGFMAEDKYYFEIAGWLRRIGYRPYKSNIGRNAGCFDLKVKVLLQTVEKAYLETGRKVHFIGHSLGGLLSRAAAEQSPEKVSSVITMGSPFRGISSHPILGQMQLAVRQRIKLTNQQPDRPDCFTTYCDCGSTEALKQSLENSQIRHTAIYSKRDGVVDWRMCINVDPSTNIEVNSTHCGMAFNPFVYWHIGKRLAMATA